MESGKFKRNRAKISVIDIDEVKMIEAQKAEEKKRLLVLAGSKKETSSSDKSGIEEGEIDKTDPGS